MGPWGPRPIETQAPGPLTLFYLILLRNISFSFSSLTPLSPTWFQTDPFTAFEPSIFSVMKFDPVELPLHQQDKSDFASRQEGMGNQIKPTKNWTRKCYFLFAARVLGRLVSDRAGGTKLFAISRTLFAAGIRQTSGALSRSV